MPPGSGLLGSIFTYIEDKLYEDRQDGEHVSDEDMDTADQKDFAHWEMQVMSRAPWNYDFDTRDPASGRAVQEEARSLLSFFKDLNILGGDDNHLGEDDGLFGFDEPRYSETQKANELNELPHTSWPSGTEWWGSVADRLTKSVKIFEQKTQPDDVVEHMRPIDSSVRSSDNCAELDHYGALYELLVNKAVCKTAKHSALLQLQSADQPQETVDIYLYSCNPEEPMYKHRTSIKLERFGSRQKQVRGHDQHLQLDICNQIRTHYKDNRRRLYLGFDKNGIRVRADPRCDLLPRPPGPRAISLSDALRSDTFDTEELGVTLKKSRLALELALSVHCLYAGPWIQHTLNAEAVTLLYEKDSDSDEDFSCACIPCDLVQDWQGVNNLWRECQMKECPNQRYSSFFLSFAQLLVDISLGKKRDSPLTEVWHVSLIEEAERMIESPLLERYGNAVLACVHFLLDYNLARDSEHGSNASIARRVILNRIVQNLWDHFHIWKNQYDHQVSECHDLDDHVAKNLKEDTNSRKNESKYPTWRPGEIPASHFTLFAAGDENYEKPSPQSKPSESRGFWMKGFIDNYVLLAKCQVAVKPPPVVIAVLDTGVCIDKDDEILYAGSQKRIRKDSRNYLNPKGNWEGWDRDEHGHGTHIVRILLQNTVSAEIVVLKVARARKMEYTQNMLERFIQALNWAGEHADIINLSIGLDEAAKLKIHEVIRDIVFTKGKLIFAAASNSGGNGKRGYPAKEHGVFAIHATTEYGASPDEDMNPPAYDGPGMDNFATLGCGIPSRWRKQDISISGTSFATPIAAAIAANALEFTRLAPPGLQSSPGYFSSPRGMRHLFHLMASKIGNYDFVRPWKEGMFRTDQTDYQQMHQKLREISLYRES